MDAPEMNRRTLGDERHQEKPPMRFVCKFGLALCCLPLLMGASVYRWVDEGGVINYSQLKPEGVEAELVMADTGQRIGTTPPPASAGAGADTANGEQQLGESQQKMLDELKAAEAQRREQIAKLRAANCRQARDQLESLTSRGRIRVKGEDGTERVMPDEERRGRIDEAQRAVAANCSETAGR
jgi:hypothetical protein